MFRGAAMRNLVLATIAFIVSFSVWGVLSGLAPIFKVRYGLTATQTGLVVAIPILLGSVGRIPVGILTDRMGGRRVFSAILLFGLVPTLALAADHTYRSLLVWGLFLGLMGTSFAVGAGFVAGWFPPRRQGTALGIYGVGNVGQSLALAGAPFLANAVGVAPTLQIFGVVSVLWGAVFALTAQNAPVRAPHARLEATLRLIGRERRAWLLSLLYFQTFGGFIALGIALPTLLRDRFGLTVEDAGARAAGFVVLATACRPIGGWIADRIGGERLLSAVFVALALCAWFMVFDSIYPFTVGALGSAVLFGLGNGGVFKLVPGYFPAQVGAVSGLVGAAGGLGGFFPPIVLGLFKDFAGTYVPGFILLSVFAAGCAMAIQQSSRRDAARAREAALAGGPPQVISRAHRSD